MKKLIDREKLVEELGEFKDHIKRDEKLSEKFKDGYKSALSEVEELANSLRLLDLEERIPVDRVAGVQLENKQKDSEDQKEFYSSVFETDRKVASQINFIKSVFGNGSKYSWLELNTRKGYVIKILLQEEEKNDE